MLPHSGGKLPDMLQDMKLSSRRLVRALSEGGRVLVRVMRSKERRDRYKSSVTASGIGPFKQPISVEWSMGEIDREVT